METASGKRKLPSEDASNNDVDKEDERDSAALSNKKQRLQQPAKHFVWYTERNAWEGEKWRCALECTSETRPLLDRLGKRLDFYFERQLPEFRKFLEEWETKEQEWIRLSPFVTGDRWRSLDPRLVKLQTRPWYTRPYPNVKLTTFTLDMREVDEQIVDKIVQRNADKGGYMQMYRKSSNIITPTMVEGYEAMSDDELFEKLYKHGTCL